MELFEYKFDEIFIIDIINEYSNNELFYKHQKIIKELKIVINCHNIKISIINNLYNIFYFIPFYQTFFNNYYGKKYNHIDICKYY